MSRTYIAGVVFAASVFLLSVVSAFGESYSVNVIKYTQSEGFYGIDAAGNFVVNVSDTLGYGSGCAGAEGASQCFATYYVGQKDPVLSAVAPGLAYDNGSACSQTVGGDSISGVCNGGYQLLGGYLGDRRGVWTGTDPLTDFLWDGSFDGGFLNGTGDAVFIDGMHDALVSVVHTGDVADFDFSDAKMSVVVDPKPVPEPESLALVGSGLLALAEMRRRRMS